MRRSRLWIGLGFAVGAGLTLLLCLLAASLVPAVTRRTVVAAVPTLDPDRVRRGEPLYAQHCASCHGANLEGAPNWEQPLEDGSRLPPPHDSSGHTWHHPDALLLRVIADGGDPAYNSKMPGFKDRLTPEEMRLILDFIKSRWGTEERRLQWEITRSGGGF